MWWTPDVMCPPLILQSGLILFLNHHYSVLSFPLHRWCSLAAADALPCSAGLRCPSLRCRPKSALCPAVLPLRSARLRAPPLPGSQPRNFEELRQVAAAEQLRRQIRLAGPARQAPRCNGGGPDGEGDGGGDVGSVQDD
ncbi:unnamed protein product [Urochloa humidicola]